MSEKRTLEEGRFAGLALAEEELVARVAWCYYHDGLTERYRRAAGFTAPQDFAPAGEGAAVRGDPRTD
jgi:hypothetical protein